MAEPNAEAAARLASWQTRAAQDRDDFFADVAQQLEWIESPTVIEDVSFEEADFHIRWYADGVLNASVNALDRHLAERGDDVAILFEPDAPDAPAESISFRELHRRVCQLGNALRALGIDRGDVVAIYLPMIPDATVAMLACARIGAVHNVVFGGFSAAALAGRIGDSRARLVITADQGRRGGKPVPLKETVDRALQSPAATSVETVLVVRHTGAAVPMQMPRDRWFDVVADHQSEVCEPAAMAAEDPLFILYTSGSTGQPKGLVHTTGGYLAWVAFTHQLVFGVAPGDVWWCTADVGWITGHSYVVYGPLANGVTTLMFEGVPTWPDASRFWQVVDRHQVTHFYTAPTAIRALMRDGDAPVAATSRASLKVLGTVGEPINPEAFRWYDDVVGDGRCPVVDTWWQTETGGILIAPCAGTIEPKPGAAMQALPGIEPALVDADGSTIEGPGAGFLVLDRSWPGQARTIHGDPERFFETYFRQYPGRYFTGDGARRDADGDLWITGRVDDVINVSGHRIGTAEVESALVAHADVAEAAVVGMPHELKGQGIYAFVTPMAGIEGDEALRSALIAAVRSAIGPIAAPDVIQFAAALPKTRSGKIMRRILRRIAAGETDGFGDTSTLADPAVVDALARDRPSRGG